MKEEKNKKESSILNKILDYKNYTFKVNWASGITLFGALVWAITATIMLNGEFEKVDGLITANSKQDTTISILRNAFQIMKGNMEIVKESIKAFNASPPSEIKAKIDGINRVIDIYHGNNAVNNAVNNMPPPTTAFPSSVDSTNSMGGAVPTNPDN